MFAANGNLTLPRFGNLALVGLAANAPLIAVALMLGYVKAGVSLFGGYILALVIYGLLYLVVGRGLDAVDLAGIAPKDKADKSSAGLANAAMVGVMMGKYVVVALLLYFAWHTGYLLVVPFIVGFMAAQVGITWASIAQSKRNPLPGSRS